MLVFLLTLHHFKISYFLASLLLLLPIYQCLPGSFLSLLSLVPLPITSNIFFSLHCQFPWCLVLLSHISQQITSLGSIDHQFFQLLPLIPHVIKENHTITWTSANSNFDLLLVILSRGNNSSTCPSLLNPLSYFPW